VPAIGRLGRRRLLAEVERAGGWQRVLERIESSEPLAKIADSFQVSRGCFTRLLYETVGHHERVLRARKVAADALVDEAQGILDSASATQYELQHAKLRAEFRVWLASKLDRERYGDAKPAQKAVSIGELHLEALRARPTRRDSVSPPPVRVAAVRRDRARRIAGERDRRRR
jgi:hypothetical protein